MCTVVTIGICFTIFLLCTLWHFTHFCQWAKSWCTYLLWAYFFFWTWNAHKMQQVCIKKIQIWKKSAPSMKSVHIVYSKNDLRAHLYFSITSVHKNAAEFASWFTGMQVLQRGPGARNAVFLVSVRPVIRVRVTRVKLVSGLGESTVTLEVHVGC